VVGSAAPAGVVGSAAPAGVVGSAAPAGVVGPAAPAGVVGPAAPGRVSRRGLVGISLASMAAHALSEPKVMNSTDATLADLRALNARFIHNFVTNDVASHDAILHPRFVCIGAGGARVDRASYLRAWATGFDAQTLIHWDTRDERIDVFGDVALVRATNRHVQLKDGVEVVGMTCYTDTYLREQGRWLCIQAQLTPVAPAHYPSDSSVIGTYIRGRLQPRG
jgi:ketosteroid isomerase-like protein